jgi:hypothetical protein
MGRLFQEVTSAASWVNFKSIQNSLAAITQSPPAGLLTKAQEAACLTPGKLEKEV